MEVGFGVPTRGAMATPESMATLAKQGENLGFGIISVSDHVVIPKNIASTYPWDTGTVRRLRGQCQAPRPGGRPQSVLPGFCL
jgi:hypothetical protein